MEAYLDIETTGLSRRCDAITVVGINLHHGIRNKFVQLVGDDITPERILRTLKGVEAIYTYNGSRFDLPFINYHLGINLAKLFRHCDLMYHCWANNLYGGLKCVEGQLGITRHLSEITGYDAVRLWWKYTNNHDDGALNILLEYNREDVLNLKILKDMLLR